jgi:anti-sigma B factor antagonist
MNIGISKVNGISVISLDGKMDFHATRQEEGKILEAAQAGEITIINCEKLEYICSSGLRTFMILLKKTRGTSRTLSFCGVREDILGILEMTGIKGMMTLYGSLEEALASLAPAS